MSFVACDLGDAHQGKPLKSWRAGGRAQDAPQALAES